MRYPGGKFRCYQRLINLIPPHQVYIESHLGGGAVLRHKAPAQENVGVDVDSRALARFKDFPGNYRFVYSTAEAFLDGQRFRGDEFIYADPPYWPASRRSSRSPYRHDYTESDHLRLLQLLLTLDCRIMISGYDNRVYADTLRGWRRESFMGTSHVGRREETVWMNYSPGELHDTRYLGADYRERQAVNRKRMRWVRRFLREPVAVRQAILSDLQSAHQKP